MKALASSSELPAPFNGKVIRLPGTHRHKPSFQDLLFSLNKLMVTVPHGFECYGFDKIYYLKAQNNYTEVYTTVKKILLSKTLKSLEHQLPDTLFCRVHKSYVVNLYFIKSYINSTVDPYLVLEDDTHIPVSRSRKAQFR